MKWSAQTWHKCTEHLFGHHVTYLIEPFFIVIRKQHTIGEPCKKFIVGAFESLEEAKMKAEEDFELWLAGESEAEPCNHETMI